MLILAAKILADVAADNELEGVFDEATQRQQQNPSREALRRLFDKYGGRESGQITFEGFEHLFASIGLGHVVFLDHDVYDHHADDGQFRSLHDHHDHTDVPQQSNYREHHHHQQQHQHHDHHHQGNHSHDHQQRHKRLTGDASLQPSTPDGSDISQVSIVDNTDLYTYVAYLHRFQLSVNCSAA